MLIVEISVVPVGTGNPGVSKYIRTAVEIIKSSGLNYSINPMGTCVEGEWDEIFSTLKKIHDRLAAIGCQRLVTTIKIDDRRDRNQTMQDKVSRVSP
ncbi:MAG: MTH1187 family thiamine-binding protein [candidate division WOR-3 bacterium]